MIHRLLDGHEIVIEMVRNVIDKTEASKAGVRTILPDRRRSRAPRVTGLVRRPSRQWAFR